MQYEDHFLATVPDDQDKDLLFILDSVIQFNPYYRKSASECLKIAYFDDIRDEEKEIHKLEKVMLDIDQDEAFDYELGKGNVSKEECEKLLMDLIA